MELNQMTFEVYVADKLLGTVPGDKRLELLQEHYTEEELIAFPTGTIEFRLIKIEE